MTNKNTGHNTGHGVLYYKTDGDGNESGHESGQCVPIRYTSKFNGIGHGIRQSVQYEIKQGNSDAVASRETSRKLSGLV